MSTPEPEQNAIVRGAMDKLTEEERLAVIRWVVDSTLHELPDVTQRQQQRKAAEG